MSLKGLTILWLAIIFGASWPKYASTYDARYAQVTCIQEAAEEHEPDQITIRTDAGDEYTFGGWAGGWELGARYRVFMDNNGTADPSDDRLFDVM